VARRGPAAHPPTHVIVILSFNSVFDTRGPDFHWVRDNDLHILPTTLHGLAHGQQMTTNGGNRRVDRVYYRHATTSSHHFHRPSLVISFILNASVHSDRHFRSITSPSVHLTSLLWVFLRPRFDLLHGSSMNGDRLLITTGYFVDRQWGWGTSYREERETIQDQGRTARTLDSLAFFFFLSMTGDQRGST